MELRLSFDWSISMLIMYAELSGHACADCAAGRAQPLPGQSECFNCTAGAHLPGASSCSNCAIGKYNRFPLDSDAICLSCPSGYFQADLGQVQCDSCPTGFSGTGYVFHFSFLFRLFSRLSLSPPASLNSNVRLLFWRLFHFAQHRPSKLHHMSDWQICRVLGTPLQELPCWNVCRKHRVADLHQLPVGPFSKQVWPRKMPALYVWKV